MALDAQFRPVPLTAEHRSFGAVLGGEALSSMELLDLECACHDLLNCCDFGI